MDVHPETRTRVEVGAVVALETKGEVAALREEVVMVINPKQTRVEGVETSLILLASASMRIGAMLDLHKTIEAIDL